MKKLNLYLFQSVMMTTVLLINGCGESRPDGMPELYPATVTITQAGNPLSDATVTLYPNDSALRRWTVGGRTDATGTATLTTHTKYDGAPAGSFKVMVNKTETEGDPIPKHPGANATQDQLAAYDRAMKTGSFMVYQVVAEEFRTAGNTPLSIEITADGENAFIEDIGEAVQELDEQASATGGAGGDYVPMGGS
ncbi:hypothetical protein RMSM_05108 [Rhodopirellula maiorica SM1]|uniref:Uncharacterized protein n=1 Tax=Rhodopirellula maiorica SM1 TaxID=1265738 RepID=M5RER7_9BACT|nr:hypothetical protein [Rhodopirellula maiorica]EMI17963.1 hypothetical protein RMSM_05108 [Rhodopirellula maiorica SM1]